MPAMVDVCFPRLHKAIRWACKLHKEQDRDGGAALPYITHVIEVVSNLRYVGGVTDEDLLCVAALHDVVEQSAAPIEKIEKRFGPRVRKLVEELTRREPGIDETQGMSADKIWKLRSSILLDEISKMSPDAQKVKLADRLSNVRNAVQTKIGGKLERTLKQTEEILKIIPRRRSPRLWNAIRAELDSYRA
jgi:GTP diphosphokinase / guanosine-3',5'-bis(diphosphate) 3'-diphosphatase